MDQDLTPVEPIVVDDPAKPWKAYAATALSFVFIVVSAWIADDGGVTGKEVAAWVLSGLVGCGLTGGTTYLVRNPKKVA